MRRATKYGVVHCTMTDWDREVDIEEVHRWHVRRGIQSPLGSLSGYHGLIKRDGSLQLGRLSDEIGAHTPGYNDVSVSVIMVAGLYHKSGAGDNFSLPQLQRLGTVVSYWKKLYPGIEVLGHCDLIKGSKCPCLDVRSWMVSIFNNIKSKGEP